MQYKKFGYQGEEGTCLWCGVKLRRELRLADNHDELMQAALAQGLPYDKAFKAGMVRAKKAGPYEDDTFCTMSCGYWFGLRMARMGLRVPS